MKKKLLSGMLAVLMLVSNLGLESYAVESVITESTVVTEQTALSEDLAEEEGEIQQTSDSNGKENPENQIKEEEASEQKALEEEEQKREEKEEEISGQKEQEEKSYDQEEQREKEEPSDEEVKEAGSLTEENTDPEKESESLETEGALEQIDEEEENPESLVQEYGLLADGEVTEEENILHINPLYKDIINVDQLKAELEEIEQNYLGEEITVQGSQVYASIEEAGAYLRDEMIKRSAVVTVSVSASLGNAQDLFDAVLEEAFVHTEEGSGQIGDALRWTYGGLTGSMSTSGGVCNITYTISYYTTLEQEQALTAKVNSIMQELALDGKNDIEKVRAIHDKICEITDYDYYNLNNNPNYKLMYTAYAALCNGTAVCQGYAVAFYRLCKEVGLSVRIISGLGNGGNHAWNIVKVGDYYYNIDTTWDGQDPETHYGYYLQNEIDFADHVRDEEYDTAEFHTVYPMAKYSYGKETLTKLEKANLNFTFTTISESTVSTSASGKPKVLIFYNASDSNGLDTIQDVSELNITTADIIAVEVKQAAKSTVEQVKASYGNDSIIFCYDTTNTTNQNFWRYPQTIAGISSITYPVLVYIDAQNIVQYFEQGQVTGGHVEDILIRTCGLTQELDTYELTLDANGGIVSPQKVDTQENGTYPGLPNPTRNGYNFVGWYTGAEGGKLIKEGDSLAENKNHTLYAKWNPITYSLNYELNGGSTNGGNPLQYTIETDTFTLKNAVPQYGETFAGWYKENTFRNKVTNIPTGSTGNITYYARWKMATPTFVTEDSNVGYGQKIALQTARPGAEIYYSLDGSDPVVGGHLYGGEIRIEEEVTIRAITAYEDHVPSEIVEKRYIPYTSVFTLKDQSLELRKNVPYTLEIEELPTGKTEEDVTWTSLSTKIATVNKGVVTPLSVGQTTIRATVKDYKGSTITAECVVKVLPAQYQVVFYGYEGNVIKDEIVEEGKNAEPPEAEVREGYLFTGWDTSYKSIKKHTDVHPVYAPEIYRVNYQLNGGSTNGGNPDQYTIETETITLKSAASQYKETFEGWYEDNSFSKKVTNIAQGSTGEITLYAKWKLNAPVFIKEESSVDKGEKVTLQTARPGAKIYYTIDGTNPTTESNLYSDGIEINERVTIRAIAAYENHTVSEVAVKEYIPQSTTFTLDISELQLYKGEDFTFEIKELPDGRTASDVSWTSLNTRVVQVEKGKITAVAAGTAMVKASTTDYKGRTVTAECKITVHSGKVPTLSLYFSETEATYIGSAIDFDSRKTVSASWYDPRTEEDVQIETNTAEVKYYSDSACTKEVAEIVNAGQYWAKATLRGLQGYEDCQAVVPLKVNPLPMENNLILVEGISEEYTFTGAEIKPVPVVKLLGTPLQEGKAYDYVVSYQNNKEYGTATITLTGQKNFTGSKVLTFEITPMNLATEKEQGNITVNKIKDVTFNNTEQKPAITVKYKGKALKLNQDYTVEYRNNKLVGEAIASIKGINSYEGTIEAAFHILPLDLSKITVTSLPSFEYSGTKMEPDFRNVNVTLKIGKDTVTLEGGTDYRIKCLDNENVGTASVVFEGIGNYKGMAVKTFKILPKELNANDFEASLLFDREKKTKVPYTGAAITPEAEIIYHTEIGQDKTMEYGKDYTLSYSKNKTPGIAQVTVTGKGNYKGKLILTFEIGQATLEGATVTATDMVYTGKAVKPKVTVVDSLGHVVKASEYTVSYDHNIEVSNGKAGDKLPIVIVTAKPNGNYEAGTSSSTNFKIGYNLSKATVELPAQNVEYTGQAIEFTNPGVKVKVAGEEISKGEYGYQIAYSNNTNVGKASLVITPGEKSDYVGSITKTFTIKAKKADGFSVADISEVIYNGTALKPQVVVSDGEKVLEAEKDYTLSYANNTNAGQATVTIKGKGNYTGTVKKSFTIRPLNLKETEIFVDNLAYNEKTSGKPKVVVKTEKGQIVPASGYTVAYKDYKGKTGLQENTITITAKGKNTIGSNGENSFYIGKDLKSAKVGNIGKKMYGRNGVTLSPNEIKVTLGTEVVSPDNYTVSYEKNNAAGTAKVILTGKPEKGYIGTVTKTFVIEKKSLTAEDIYTSNILPEVYTGKTVIPEITIYDNGELLEVTKDYTVSCSNNTKIGTAKVTITGKGNYSGKLTKEFTISLYTGIR